jgi:hypothetical protein
MVFSVMKRRARLIQPSSLLEVEDVIQQSIDQDLSINVLRRMFAHAFPFAGA